MPEVVTPASEAQRADLNQRVESKALDGYLWLEQASRATTLQVSFVSRSAGNVFSLRGIQSAIDRGIDRAELIRHGATSAEVAATSHHPDIETMQIRNGQLLRRTR